MKRALVPLLPLLLLILAGCVSPAWDDHDYALKAGATAGSAASTVELVRRAVTGRDHVTREYFKVLLTEADQSLGDVNAQFGGVQPPTEAAERIGDQVTELTTKAEDTVSRLLFEVRRGEVTDPEQVEARLRDLGAKLRAIAEAHK